MKLKTNFTALLFCSAAIYCSAQDSSEDVLMGRELDLVEFTTPSEWSFFKYLENPVGLYRGCPDISVNLFTLKDGDIEIPVELRYNTSGIKVEEEASWVGLGWNLNLGGYIVKQIIDGDDEFDNNFPAYRQIFYGQSQNVNTFGSMQISQTAYNTVAAIAQDVPDYYHGKLAPDVYYFSFPGNVGKYVVDYRDSSICLLQREEDLLIDNSVDGQGLVNNKAKKITDKNGIVHNFGHFASAYLYGCNNPISESFVLSNSVYPNGDMVEYDYSRFSYLKDKHNAYTAGTIPSEEHSSPLKFKDCLEQIQSNIGRIVTEESLLDSIRTPNYLIYFDKSPRQDLDNAQKLDTIIISDRSTRIPLKKFAFNYSYFEREGSDSKSSKRLKLISVIEVATTDKHLTENNYSFDYYDSNLLPDKDSYSTDHWGYANSSQNVYVHQNMVDLQDFASLYDADFPKIIEAARQGRSNYSKKANRKLCSAGMLKSLVYPTGGRTEFEYESNSFTNYNLPSKYIDNSTDTPIVSASIIDRNSEFDNNSFAFNIDGHRDLTINYHIERGSNSWESMANSEIILVNTRYGAITYLLGEDFRSILNSLDTQGFYSSSLQLPLEAGSYILCISIPNSLGDQNGASLNHGCFKADISYIDKDLTSAEEQEEGSYGCGARVAAIRHYDEASDNCVCKRYSYIDPASGKSSGKLFDFPCYFRVYNNIVYNFESGLPDGASQFAIAKQFEIFDSPIQNNPYRRCSGVGYSVVTETIDNIDGKTQYEFVNEDTSDNVFSYRVNGELNGKLLNKSQIDQNGNIVYSISHSYNKRLSHSLYGVNLHNTENKFSQLAINSQGAWLRPNNYAYHPNAFLVLLYNLNTYDIVLTHTTENNHGQIKETEYSYDEETLLTRKSIVRQSDGSLLETRFSYPQDYSGHPYNNLVDRHIISPVVEIKQYRNNKLISALLLERNSCGQVDKASKGLIHNGTLSYPHCYYQCTERDSRFNPVHCIFDDNYSVQYSWSSDGRFPVSKLINNTFLYTYSYDALGGITEECNPRNVSMKYSYDPFHRLCKVERSCSSGYETLEEYSYSSKKASDTNGFNQITHTTNGGRDGDDCTVDVYYFNDLGMLRQEVFVAASDNGKSIIKPHSYDYALREPKDYLPFEINSSSSDYQISALSSVHSFWRSSYHFYHTTFEPFSDGLPTSVCRPGYTKPQQFSYSTNEEKEVRLIFADANGNLRLNSYYEPGSLSKKHIMNEDSLSLVVFSDIQGKVILERRENADTYYVYNDKSELAYVMQPSAIPGLSANANYAYSSIFCKLHCYSYKYDKRGRQISKRQPQCGETQFVYDNSDRIIATQHANDKENGIWRTKDYDINGRLVREGVLWSSLSREELQANTSLISQARASIVYYYDSYPEEATPFVPRSGLANQAVISNNTQELLTHKKVYPIKDDSSLSDGVENYSYYYDYLGRCVQVIEQDPFLGRWLFTQKYDFKGNCVLSEECCAGHIKTVASNYDNRDRIKNIITRLDGQEMEDLVFNYDVLNRTTYVQELISGVRHFYEYNLQDRLSKHSALIYSTPCFEEECFYETGLNNTIAKDRYSGDISALRIWTPSKCDSLAFSYDTSGRLQHGGIFKRGNFTAQCSEMNIRYDLNGNICSLSRYEGGSLKYRINNSYKGNRSTRNQYDQNGNILYDQTSDTHFEWNHLNLPDKISSGDEYLLYYYLSDGTKRMLSLSSGDSYEYRGSFVFFYSQSNYNSFFLDNVNLCCGKVFYETQGATRFPVPYHYIQDHSNSTRVIINANSKNIVEIDDYFPYGSRANNNLPTFTKNRFRFNGKEEQTLNNSLLLDYGARMYDPNQCRWLTPDPLAEKYYHLSPYSFCANNPINFIDPDGKYIKYKSTNGELNLEYNKNMKICD